jgi:hypothetical protein
MEVEKPLSIHLINFFLSRLLVHATKNLYLFMRHPD